MNRRHRSHVFEGEQIGGLENDVRRDLPAYDLAE
jgi:hypothetical protein